MTTQFQARKADEQSTPDVVRSINSRGTPLAKDSNLEKLFSSLWPELQSMLEQVPEADHSVKPARPQHEVLEDVVQSLRTLERRITEIEQNQFATLHAITGIPIGPRVEEAPAEFGARPADRTKDPRYEASVIKGVARELIRLGRRREAHDYLRRSAVTSRDIEFVKLLEQSAEVDEEEKRSDAQTSATADANAGPAQR